MGGVAGLKDFPKSVDHSFTTSLRAVDGNGILDVEGFIPPQKIQDQSTANETHGG